MGPLVDRFGRVHDDLRLSVTENCNLRCIYCMDEDNSDFLSKNKFWSLSELKLLLKIFKKLNINSVRITGGEPLIRKDIVEIVEIINSVGFLDIALTTNGMHLAKYAKDLKLAGLKRINLSIDSLNPEKFAKIRRRGDLNIVLKGLEVASLQRFDSIKVNVVAIKGINDDEILDFIEFSKNYRITVRFIELMPVGATDLYKDSNVLTRAEIIERISSVYDIVENMRTNSPAEIYSAVDGSFEFGVIASMSEPFCDKCNRIRLTADGYLRNCLFSRTESSLISLIRNNKSEEEIEFAIRQEIFRKAFGHGTDTVGYTVPDKPIYKVGG